jgi:uncharacterized membrane protein YhdT
MYQITTTNPPNNNGGFNIMLWLSISCIWHLCFVVFGSMFIKFNVLLKDVNILLIFMRCASEGVIEVTGRIAQ